MTYTLPTAVEIKTGLVVEFEIQPKYPSAEQLVRIYNEHFVGAHYLSLAAFEEHFSVVAEA